MSDKSTPRVSLGKATARATAQPTAQVTAQPTARANGTASLAAPDVSATASTPRRAGKTDEPRPDPPKLIRYAVIALAVSAVGALVASLSLFGLDDWLHDSLKKSNDKLKPADRRTPAELNHAVSTAATTQLIGTVVLVVALLIAARIVWRGSFRARWAVLVFWLLATFTGTFAGFTYILTIGADEPLALKVPAFVAAVSLGVAVVLTNLRPSVAFFNLNRPTRLDPAARRGLFGPRATPAARTLPASGAAETSAQPRGRARTKQRADADAAARGADLARARAKASKSRRTGD